METWAIVVLVVGTNLGTALLALLGIKKQLKHSDKRFAKEFEAKREADEHNRKWVVRSQPLLELRAELASMAEKFEGLVDMATQVVEGVSINSDKIIEDHDKGVIEKLGKAVQEWEDYYYSGKFHKALHMQYNYDLKREAHGIFYDYQLAYISLEPFFKGGEGDEKINKAKDVIRENVARISAVQTKINELLEGL